MQTFALLDGGLSTAEYLWRNGVRPDNIFFSIKDVSEAVIYCDSKEDCLIFIVNSCTNIPYTAVKSIVSLLAGNREQSEGTELEGATLIEKFMLFSNIPIHIANLDFEYVFFEGDLFSGTEYIVNTKDKLKLGSLKPTPANKPKRIEQFLNPNMSVDNVTIGKVPHKYFPTFKDPINRDDIVQLEIFK